MRVHMRRTVASAIGVSVALIVLSVAHVASASRPVPVETALEAPSPTTAPSPAEIVAAEPTAVPAPPEEGSDPEPDPSAPGPAPALESTATFDSQPDEARNSVVDRSKKSVIRPDPVTARGTQFGTARVRKVTIPAGHEAGWTFSLTGPGITTPITATTTGGSFVDFLDQQGLPFALLEGTYTIEETTRFGWTVSPDKCAFTVVYPDDWGRPFGCTFTNTMQPASASVVKTTVPSGNEANWSFILTGPGTPQGGEIAQTNSSGLINFGTVLEEGDYTITEVQQPGWAVTPSSGTCTFTVDYPDNAGRSFSCEFRNEFVPARVKVDKTTDPAGFEAGWSFELNSVDLPEECSQCTARTSRALVGGEVVQTDGAGEATFATLLPAGNHTVTELQQSGWTVTPASGICEISVEYPRDAGRVFVCSFHNARVPTTPPPSTPPPTPIADVTIDKTDSQDPVVAGDNFDYELTVTNNGPDPAHNTVVSDTIPDELASVVDVTTSAGTCTFTRTVTCQLGTLNPGASVTITVTVATQPGLAAQLLNTAVVSTTTVESNTTNNQDSEPTTVIVPEPEQGVIVIEKQTLPNGSPDTFVFGGDVGGRLGDGDSVSAVVDPGTYFSQETTTITDEWDLESIVCDDADSSGDRASGTATFVVDEGETVTCTFTNSETEVDPVFIPPDPTGDPPAAETPAEVGPRALPATGEDISGLVAFGLLSLLVGATVLIGVRRAAPRDP